MNVRIRSINHVFSLTFRLYLMSAVHSSNIGSFSNRSFGLVLIVVLLSKRTVMYYFSIKFFPVDNGIL